MPYVNGGVGHSYYSDRGSEKANKSRHHEDLGDRPSSAIQSDRPSDTRLLT
jgi:hypothetical protein